MLVCLEKEIHKDRRRPTGFMNMSKPNDWEEFYNLYTIAAQTSMDGSFTTIKYTARARFFVTSAEFWLQFSALPLG